MGIWAAISGLIALFVGGTTTGRLAGILTRADGFLHGVVLWALTTVVVVWLIISGLGFLLGGAFGVHGQTAGAAVGAVGQIAPEVAGPALTGAARGEEREVLISELAQRTGLSRAEAAGIVGDAETQVQQARERVGTQLDTLQQRAPEVAQDIAGATSRAAWWVLLALGLSFAAAAFGFRSRFVLPLTIRTPMPPPLLRPLGFGEVLDGAFSLYRAHFALLFTTALIVTLPMPLASLLLAGDPQQVEAAPLRMLAMAAVVVFATLLAWAALTWQVGQAVLGRPLSTATALRRAVGALLPLFGAGVLGYSALMIVGMLAIGGLFLVVLPLSLLLPGAGVVAGTVVGALVGLALVAGLAAVLFAVPAAVVLESRGPVAALQRSWRLSAGSRLKVLGVVVVSWLIVILPSIGLVALGAGAGLAGVGMEVGPSRLWQTVDAAAGLLIGALTYPFMVGAVTVLYFERRVRSEALDLEFAAEELAAGV